jgi:hypothetical protein|tara:strand:+ start:966 stop:1337 length:372 start_codon:yes stop_codon:yes gene_type:complete
MNHKHPTILTLDNSKNSVSRLISELNSLANQTRTRITGISVFNRRDGVQEIEIFHDSVQETHDNILYKDFKLGAKVGFRSVVERINSVANDKTVKIVNVVFGSRGAGMNHLEIHAKKLRRKSS